MRDLYVEIPGKWKDRINAAYAYGGPALAIDTINKNFNLDIRYYATADFNGMKYLIDVLGGVEINIKEGEIPHINSASINQIKTAGLQHLDGQQTLAYTRIRYFGNSDYERTERQRTVLSQLYDKAKSAGVLKLGDIFSLVLPYVETNLSREDLMNLALACYSFTGSAELYRIPADGTFSEETVQSKAVLVPDLSKNTELLHKFIYNED
jgi:LCP family protein required for cell wall assembly